MKYLLVTPMAALVVWAQAPPSQTQAEVPADTVVATVNGKKLTAEQVRNMIATTPPQVQQAFAKNPEQFMREFDWYSLIQQLAEKAGLDKRSPYKERLEFQRLMTLVQAMYDEAAREVTVTRDEEKAYYAANEMKYREALAKLIYIPFSTGGGAVPGGKKVLTETEAKTKAEGIVKQARTGADFVKLVKEHSEDPGSAAQNGDIGTGVRTTTTHIPEAMRNAILALKPGQVSDPIRHENGYYVFRVESVSVLPYEKVREEIYKELKQAGFVKWQKNTQAEATIQVANEEFFRSLAKNLQQPQ
jgi:peptidyl-prolyl cis-trans isomerase C